MDDEGLAKAILAKKRDGEDGDAEDDEGESLSVAAGNVMSAIKDNNPAGLATALREFMGMCEK